MKISNTGMAVRRLAAGLTAGLALLSWGAATAQQANGYPEKSIKIIVPFNAGGAADNMARMLGQHLGDRLGQPVVVENRAGVSGVIGTQATARSAPDGYTIMVGTLSTHGLNPFFIKDVGYDPVADFVPVTMFSTYANALIVPLDSPYTSVEQIVRKLKESPGSLDYGTSGSGTSQHLAGLMFQSITGTELTQVPYKGGAAALTDLMGGHIDMVFETVSAARPAIDGKRVKALGVTSAAPLASMPGVKPLAGQGLPGFEVKSWFGVFAPKGTPPEIAARLHKEISEIVELPEVRERMEMLGSEPASVGLADFAELQRSEIDKWEKVVRQLGVQSE